MRKPDEIALAREMLKYGAYGSANVDGFVYERLGIPKKRACYIYKKWTARNWAEYGTSLRLAWLTPEGVEALTGIVPCESVDATCDSTGTHPTCCVPVLYGLVASFNGNIIRECTIPLLE